MRRLALLTAPFCLFALAVLMPQALGQEAKPEAPKKPAAVIDASRYPDLQAAFAAVPEAGGLVRLPPGDFEITKPLVLSRGNTRIEGAGAATCIVNANQQGQPSLVIRSPEFEKNSKARLWRVQLANFRVTGDPGAPNDKSTQPKSGDGILAQNIDELYVEGMTVDHHGGHGIHLVNCYEDPRIADSLITYNAQAGLNIAGGHDIVVNANHFEENLDALRCSDSFNLCMNGNNLDDHLGNGVVIEKTYGSVLSGNMIEECNGIAVVLDRDCYGITISANVIAHNMQGGVELRDAWGCAVSANT
ncbi:MAG: right-handed parallel beta-helix repeat-containing protein, partial [Pirellulales bacterium]|nr:right-handed parallel beta-helix repeat-containing protein [Pirellulales bacterium]